MWGSMPCIRLVIYGALIPLRFNNILFNLKEKEEHKHE